MKIAKYLFMIICVAIIIWVFASWIDIVADNMSPNPVHSVYNFFVLMME